MSVHDQQAETPAPPAGEQPPGAPGQERPRSRSRWWPVVAVAGVVTSAVLAGLLLTTGGDREPVASGGDDPPAASTSWISGASGDAVASGEFAEWRGQPLEIAASFVDDNERMVELEMLQPGEEYGDWQESLDVAIGAIDDDESWEDAADGDYDDRWRESLEGLAEAWEGREGTLYIRFAHEMNGDWYPWRVQEDDAEDFVEAWQRFRALQQEVFPESQLVFCVNRESVDSGIDWRETFPGAEHVDVMSVDYYNQFPFVGSDADWEESVTATDEYGAPVGLQRHLEFAEEVGLPLAVSEWNNNADEGDSAAYMENMHRFFEANAGTGPGQLLYESVFNRSKQENRWLLYGDDVRMPEAAEAYRELW